MTDQELVAAVAEKVMGWHIWAKPCDDDRYRMDGTSVRRKLANGSDRLWNPLESWDDAMMIVAAMRAKGWMFQLEDSEFYAPTERYTEVWFFRHRALATSIIAISSATKANPSSTDELRAILECACKCVTRVEA